MTTTPALEGNRRFVWFTPAGRLPTEYEMFTIGQQSGPSGWLQVDWPLRFDDGRPPYSEDSTLIRSSDWERFRDPAQMWYRPYVAGTNHEERVLDDLVAQALAGEAGAGIKATWTREVLEKYYATWPFVEYGLFMALCHPIRQALGDSVMFAVAFHASDKMRHLQDIVHLTFDLAAVIDDFDDSGARQVWMEDPAVTPTRQVIEDLIGAEDWMEIVTVVGLVFEPLVADLMVTEFLAAAAPLNGDPVTPMVVSGARKNAARHRDYVTALVRVLLDDETHGSANRDIFAGWIDAWAPRIDQAAEALSAVFDIPGVESPERGAVLARVRAGFSAIRSDLGI